jgi:hypothetical protein
MVIQGQLTVEWAQRFLCSHLPGSSAPLERERKKLYLRAHFALPQCDQVLIPVKAQAASSPGGEKKLVHVAYFWVKNPLGWILSLSHIKGQKKSCTLP